MFAAVLPAGLDSLSRAQPDIPAVFYNPFIFFDEAYHHCAVHAFAAQWHRLSAMAVTTIVKNVT